jgi:hypothetical protein
MALRRLFLTPASRRTIWLLGAMLILAMAASHVSELSIRDARDEFVQGDDELRKLTVLYLVGLASVGIPIVALMTWLCLRSHRSAVSLLSFDKKRMVLSLFASFVAAYLAYSVVIGLLKIDREIWFAIPVELAEIWYVLVLRAALVTPREPT